MTMYIKTLLNLSKVITYFINWIFRRKIEKNAWMANRVACRADNANPTQKNAWMAKYVKLQTIRVIVELMILISAKDVMDIKGKAFQGKI